MKRFSEVRTFHIDASGTNSHALAVEGPDVTIEWPAATSATITIEGSLDGATDASGNIKWFPVSDGRVGALTAYSRAVSTTAHIFPAINCSGLDFIRVVSSASQAAGQVNLRARFGLGDA